MSASNTNTDTIRCGYCNEAMTTRHRCSRCRSVYYCSPEHQKAAWASHKPVCKPPAEAAAVATPVAVPAVATQPTNTSSILTEDNADEEAERRDTADYPFNTLSREARDFWMTHDVERILVPDPLVFYREYVAKSKPVIIQGNHSLINHITYNPREWMNGDEGNTMIGRTYKDDTFAFAEPFTISHYVIYHPLLLMMF